MAKSNTIKAKPSLKSVENQKPKRLAVLEDREKTHGSFRKVATTAQIIKSAIISRGGYEPVQAEALELIATKLARIAHGDPNELDHWQDIIGYCTLVIEDLQGSL